MINPGMRAIYFSFVIADVTITMFMILFAFQNHRRFKGLNSWVISFLLQNLAVILIVLRGIIPDWSSIVLSNTILIGSLLAGLKGLCGFTGVKLNHYHNYLIIALLGIIQAWFTYVDPDLSVRNLSLAVAMLLLSAQFVWLVFISVDRNMRKLAAAIGMVYIGSSMVSLFRIINFFTGDKTSDDYFQADTFEKMVFIAYQVIFIFLSYTLALMYNRWLHFKIAAQEEKFARAFNSSPCAILLTRFSDGEIIELNKGFTKITGYDYKDAIGHTTESLGLWIQEGERSKFTRELSGGGIYEKKERFRTKSEKIITGSLSAELIYINNEKMIITSINDISLLTQKEMLLHEKVNDLERINKFMMGRELRMIELKNEINELREKLGLEKRYQV